MTSIFSIIPEDFFKPLSGMNRKEYADCISLIFNTFKPEISYGVNREIVIRVLIDYFENSTSDFIFDDEEKVVKDTREKANGVVRNLKKCGWLDYEQDINHQVNIFLLEYTIPIIESFNKVIRDEEAEYQGIISQIHALLQNRELYVKPYELIIKGVYENAQRLVSELKRLSSSIKRYIDKQTNGMEVEELLNHFFTYQSDIGSKAYLRMKTSDNIAYFRSSIIERIDEMIANQRIMDQAVIGYMEVEQCDDRHEAYDLVLGMLRAVKSDFHRLDDIVEEIDKRHSKFLKNAVLRARFLLSSGVNQEGKLLSIINSMAGEINLSNNPNEDFNFNISGEMEFLFDIYRQNFISPESFYTIPNIKDISQIDEMDNSIISEEEKEWLKEALREKNKRRFSRKNINKYVLEIMNDKERIKASTLPCETRRDMIRLIFINLYGDNKANNYSVIRSAKRITINGFRFADFEILRRQ